MVACCIAQTGCGNATEDHGGNPVESSAEAIRGCPKADTAARQGPVENLQPFKNASGLHATYSTRDGAFLETDNAFFRNLGKNGRTCGSCHAPEDGFSISAANVQQRFDRSCGLEPLFRPVDGATNPNADVSTLENRRAAYSLLLNKGISPTRRRTPPCATPRRRRLPTMPPCRASSTSKPPCSRRRFRSWGSGRRPRRASQGIR